MKVIYPKPMTDALLISSTVPEPDTDEPAAYNAATTYAEGDQCFRATTHKIYESLVAGNVDNTPEDNTEGTSPKWLEVGATNRWRMWDQYINTTTNYSGTLVVEIDASRTSSVSLIGVVGDTVTFQLYNAAGDLIEGQEITIDLKKDECTDWYDYAFLDFTYHNRCFWSYAITSGTKLKITVTPLSGVAKIGTCIFGWEKYIGMTKSPVDLGITDFSIKEDDSFGRIYLKEGAYRDTCAFQVYVEPRATDLLHQFLIGLRAKGCVWIVDNTEDTEAALQSLIIYGFMKDFGTTVYSTGDGQYNECELQIESFI